MNLKTVSSTDVFQGNERNRRKEIPQISYNIQDALQ